MRKVTVTAPTGRDSDKFMLRLPDGMRDRIKDEADKNKRSMNAEIIARLEHSLLLPAKIDNLKDAFMEVDAGHDAKDALMLRMMKVYEATKALSDQQEVIINQLLKALPDDTPSDQSPKK